MSQETKSAGASQPFAQLQQQLLKAAFDYVASFAPNVASVEFDDDCRWCYMDSTGKPVVFPEFGSGGEMLDVAPLEAIADVVDFPATYERD